MTHGHFCNFRLRILKKPAIHIFFRNLHLLTFSNDIHFAVFSFKIACIRIFFPEDTGGHPRRSGGTLNFRRLITQTRQAFHMKRFLKHDCVVSARTATPRQNELKTLYLAKPPLTWAVR